MQKAIAGMIRLWNLVCQAPCEGPVEQIQGGSIGMEKWMDLVPQKKSRHDVMICHVFPSISHSYPIRKPNQTYISHH